MLKREMVNRLQDEILQNEKKTEDCRNKLSSKKFRLFSISGSPISQELIMNAQKLVTEKKGLIARCERIASGEIACSADVVMPAPRSRCVPDDNEGTLPESSFIRGLAAQGKFKPVKERESEKKLKQEDENEENFFQDDNMVFGMNDV